MALTCLLSWGVTFAAGLLPGGYDVTKLPKPLPYTYGDVTYHHAIAWPHTGTNDHWVAYYNTALTQDESYLILTENNACFYQLEPNGPVSGNPNAWCGAVSILLNECAKTYFSDVDIVATSGGTLYNTGSCNSINYSANDTLIGAATFLSFPIPYDLNGDPYTAYTAPVSSVFDHSGNTAYSDSDHQVVTFAGEASDVQTPYSGTTCYPKADNSVFGSGFNYVGYGQNKHYLCYNGHPGYDYAMSSVDVYSAASGTVRTAAFDSCLGNHVVIDHPGGYATKYFHLASINTTNVQENYPIDVRIKIGVSGNTGSCSSGAHLHFQVEKNGVPVDPYGWTGSGADPYTAATNDVLWK